MVVVLAALGPFFTLAVGPGGRPVLDLYRNAGGALDALVERHAERLGTAERRVAASILFQEFAARLWSPVLGSVAFDLPAPDLSAARLRWRDDPFRLGVAGPAAAATEPVALVDEHLRPMVAAVVDRTGVAADLLWGNAASALVGTLTVIRLNGGRVDIATARTLLDTEPLRGTGTLVRADPPVFRRRSCCLYYRVPGGGLCGDCCLTQVPARS